MRGLWIAKALDHEGHERMRNTRKVFACFVVRRDLTVGVAADALLTDHISMIYYSIVQQVAVC